MRQVEAVPILLPATPYRGIHSFLYSDHPIFFARTTETRELLRHIVVYRGVFLYGESGAGKSSLINAGVLPAAAQEGLRPDRIRVQPRLGEELVVERIPVSADPESELLPSSFAEADDRALRVVLPAETFADRLRELPQGVRPVLVFDQFEELVTLFEEAREGDALTEAKAAQKRVVDLLVELVGDETLPVKLLFIFREDYLAKIRKLLAARPELMDQSLRLTPPSSSALGEIVRGPFEAYPGHFDHELSPELSERVIAAIEARAGSGEINLSEVQVVCLRLWNADDPDGLFEAKGVAGVLEDYLRTALDAFPGELRFPAIALLSQMVTPSGARNVVSAEDLVGRVQAEEEIERDLLERALAELEEKTRLVRRERRRDLYLYEITSEFLVPWIRARQEEFVRERELAELAEAEAQRAREWRNHAFRVAAVVLLVLVGVLAAVSAVAVWQYNVASSERREAVRLERVAQSQRLANVATSKIGIAPVRALRTAALAVEMSPTRAAKGALEEALAMSPVRAVLSGDRNPHDVAFSPNGQLVVTAGDDGARIWDASTGRRLGTLLGDGKPVIRVAFSRDGTQVVAAGQNGWARVWDVVSRQLVATLQPSRLYAVGSYALDVFVPFPSAEFSPDGSLVLTVAPDGVARVWDVKSRDELLVRRGAGQTVVNSASFSPDGARIVTAADDNTVRVWRVETGERLHVFRVGKQVARAAFARNGRRVLAVDAYGGVHAWETATGRPLRTQSTSLLDYLVSKFDISTAFSPDGRRAFTVLPDRKARLWDVVARKATTLRKAGRIVNAAFSPDSALLVTTRSDGTAQLWDAGVGAHIARLSGPSGRSSKQLGQRLYAAVFSPDSRRVVVTTADGATIFDVRRSIGRLRRIRGKESTVTSAEISPGGDSLLTTSGRAAVVQALKGRSRPVVLRGRSELMSDAAFSPDGRFLVTHNENGAHVWNTTTGRGVRYPKGTSAVAFSPDGAWTLIGRRSNAFVRSPGQPGEPRPLVLRTAAKAIDAAAFSDDGALIAVAGSDGTTTVFRPDGSVIGVLRGHAGSIESVRFDANATHVITANENGTAVVWTPYGKIVRILRGHSKRVTAAVFSPDGKLVLTTSADGTARLWDIDTGSACAVFGDTVTPVRAAEFEDANHVVVVDARGIVRTETLGLCARAVDGEVPALARQLVQPLTARERNALLQTP